jgi:hypothetical protein
MHVERDGDLVTVAASWNGSTEVRAWRVVAGPTPNALKAVGRPAQWTELETTIVRATSEPVVAIAALDADGATLARSGPTRVGRPGPSDSG